MGPLQALHGQDDPTSGRAGAQDSGSIIRAERTSEPIRIDGTLDEAIWQTAPPATGFRQRWPADGSPATERTEVRVAYDDRAIYFGMIMFDSEPDRIMRSILHREGRIDKDDRIIIALDTYLDRRSAYIFELNPMGTQGDAHFTNEFLILPDDRQWEGVYESDARVTDRGWELEVAIPLTTIRFDPANASSMGVAFYRSIRRKNEEATWPHIPLAYTGGADGGMDQASQFGTLTGLDGLSPGRHVEVKPFGILGRQKTAGDEKTTATEEIGLDVKWSVTPSLTADLTWNTDFAQVEADNVQINLTRFGLFYPEKRDFFLERSELFQFGNSRNTEVFFSRRIGLTNDIIGGGRLTGQAGPFSIGFLNLQTEDNNTDEIPGANNTVLRLRGDVGPRATVGGIFTNYQSSESYNRAAGVDLRYRFFSSSALNAWFSNTWQDGGSTDGRSAAYVGLQLRNDRFSVSSDYTNIGDQYDPALGFVRRRDMVRYGGSVAWTPRFEESTWARQASFQLLGNYIHGQDGKKQSDELIFYPSLTFQSGFYVLVGLTHHWERLVSPFPIRPGVIIPPGDYPYNYAGVLFQTNDSKALSAQGVTHRGEFWNGDWFQYGGAVTWKTGPHLELTGSFDRREIDLPVENGEFETTILGLDVLGALSRTLFANALVQYDNDSETIQANVRIDWIHTPGSDLFLVLNTGYFQGDLLDPREDRWVNRAGVVKLTYLKAF
ncbi:MAG: DUF5916 domain-containing protein [Gemmatimonadota bacterium]|jgi:hypothetical protein